MERNLTPEEEAKCVHWRMVLLERLNKAFHHSLKRKHDDASNLLDELIDKAAEWQNDLMDDSERRQT